MSKYKYRAGKNTAPNTYRVRLEDSEGFTLYKRDLVSGVIRDMPSYLKSLLDSAVMVDRYEDYGFGDLDMVAEVNGHLLNIEFKGSFARLLKSKGQLALAVNMAKTSKVTTIFVEGSSDNPKRVFSVSHAVAFNDWEIRKVNGVDGLNGMIRNWGRYANRQSPVNKDDTLKQLQKRLMAQL